MCIAGIGYANYGVSLLAECQYVTIWFIYFIYIKLYLYVYIIYIHIVYSYDLVCHFASYNVMISRRLMCGDMIWQMLREDDIVYLWYFFRSASYHPFLSYQGTRCLSHFVEEKQPSPS